MLNGRDVTPSGLNGTTAYEGTVVNNVDEMHLGRVQVRVPKYFDGIPDKHLPWAVPDASGGGGGGGSYGAFPLPPRIGSKVGVKFQRGDPHKPVWVGMRPTQTTIVEEIKHNYPDRGGEVYPNGLLMIHDIKTNEVFFRNPGDVRLYVVGNVDLQVNGNVNQTIKGNRTTYIQGNDSTIVDGTLTHYAANVNIKAEGVLNAGGDGGTNVGASGVTNVRGSHVGLNDPGSNPAVSKPAAPTAPAWPGIRGNIPK